MLCHRKNMLIMRITVLKILTERRLCDVFQESFQCDAQRRARE